MKRTRVIISCLFLVMFFSLLSNACAGQVFEPFIKSVDPWLNSLLGISLLGIILGVGGRCTSIDVPLVSSFGREFLLWDAILIYSIIGLLGFGVLKELLRILL